ncbi:unnamed protein product [Arabidopsis thaliana]|uniref:(thale cress) hypothetical protein n=1 Tax=Arabidopsis thaliana TaxID=3702 RepID=A0A7G2FJR5_ARATH|nr:unnamed protein product [Arabidopsis thaliana]
MREITFEFSHTKIGDKIIECGVQIMTEGAEGDSSRELDSFETESSSSQVGNFEFGGNNNHHTDGNGDGNYEAEGSKFSQDENIKTSKRTGFMSWLRKLGQ